MNNKLILATTLALACAGPTGLTGCATKGEVASLRTEVEQSNAIAVRAAADATISRREVAKIKAATNPLETCSSDGLFKPLTAPGPGSSGYKWDAHLKPPFDYLTQASEHGTE